MSMRAATGLGLYSRASQASSALVIREYSTSFRFASTLLGRTIRPHIESIYALVRIADEVVDGAAAEAGLGEDAQRALLDALETETERGMREGYSTNPIVHSFALTARGHGIGTELTAPFFRSMRRDLSPVAFTAEELDEYIYGSAEVVGLMCLRVFLGDGGLSADGRRAPAYDRDRLEHGARRLGAAFQKVNFLRDLADDLGQRGRSYLPGVGPGGLCEHDKEIIVADIRSDLAAAGAVIPLLPPSCRRAVAAAHALFAELTARIERTAAETLLDRRVRVPTANKLLLLAGASAGRSARPAP